MTDLYHGEHPVDMTVNEARAAIAAMDAHLPPDLAELEAAHAAVISGNGTAEVFRFFTLAHNHLPALLARLRLLESEATENARIIGMGGERQLTLLARLRKLEAALEAIKTEATRKTGRLVHLRRVIALQAKSALEGQEP